MDESSGTMSFPQSLKPPDILPPITLAYACSSSAPWNSFETIFIIFSFFTPSCGAFSSGRIFWELSPHPQQVRKEESWMPQEELRAASGSKETGKDLHQNLAAHRLLPRSLARPKDFLHPLGAELFFKRFQFSVKKFFIFHFFKLLSMNSQFIRTHGIANSIKCSRVGLS